MTEEQIGAFLFWVITMAQVGDFITTKEWFAKGGKERVGLDAWFMRKLGQTTGLVVAKLAAVAVAAGLLALTMVTPVAVYVLGAVAAFYAWVLWNNFRALRQMEKGTRQP